MRWGAVVGLGFLGWLTRVDGAAGAGDEEPGRERGAGEAARVLAPLEVPRHALVRPGGMDAQALRLALPRKGVAHPLILCP
eukprot:2170497-Rhodomonas_salina.3